MTTKIKVLAVILSAVMIIAMLPAGFFSFVS